MKNFSIYLSVFFAGLLIFCIPVMTVNAQSHHDVTDEAHFDCAFTNISSLSCCFNSVAGNFEKFVSASGGGVEVLPTLVGGRTFSVDHFSNFVSGNLFTPVGFVAEGAATFLTGTVQKRE